MQDLIGKRIVLASKYLGGITGGAERNLVDMANHLARSGAEASIVVFEKGNAPPAFALDRRVRLINARTRAEFHGDFTSEEIAAEAARRAPHADDPAALEWYEKSVHLRVRWERAIRSLDPQLLVTFLPHSSTPLLEQLRGDIPMLVTNQNTPAADYFDPTRHDPDPFDRRRRLENLRFARAVHVLIPDFVDQFPEDIRQKVVPVPNVVQPQERSVTDRSSVNRTIVGIGRLVEQKGFGLLVEAMRVVAREAPDWRLELYGEGPLRDELASAIRKASLQRHVILRGPTTRPLEAMLEADVFVIPSRYEGWGLTLTEAMSVALPCVGLSSCSGVNYLIEDGKTGLLAESDPAALAAAILSLIKDANLRLAIGRRARSRVSEFHPDVVYRRWDEIIGRLIG